MLNVTLIIGVINLSFIEQYCPHLSNHTADAGLIDSEYYITGPWSHDSGLKISQSKHGNLFRYVCQQNHVFLYISTCNGVDRHHTCFYCVIYEINLNSRISLQHHGIYRTAKVKCVDKHYLIME